MKKVEPVYLGIGSTECWFCKHFRKGEPGLLHCTAYPEQIPLEILWGNVDHRQPYVDDQGIRFELSEQLSEEEYQIYIRDFCKDPYEGLSPSPWTEDQQVTFRKEKAEGEALVRSILAKRKAAESGG